MARTRKSVWTILGEGTDELDWYARAIGRMQSYPIDNHRSLSYQAAIHDWIEGALPLRPGEQLPSDDEIDRYWRQCQHHSWFFLPWHRMYLLHFESIVRAEITALGGPGADWALPYWDYREDDESTRRLPGPFRTPALADGSPNPLFTGMRSSRMNEGLAADPRAVSATAALREIDFSAPELAGTPGFGGPQTMRSHQGNTNGVLEAVPHGIMHVTVGGDDGWMSGFHTAGLDPIFYLHHCNLDRLWKVWLRLGSGRSNPTSELWLTRLTFPFRDADGRDVEMTCREVVDTQAALLDYRYDDDEPALEAIGGEHRGPMARKRMPEMIGATESPLVLGTGLERAMVSTIATEASGLESVGGEPARMFLHLENLTCDRSGPAYDVFLGLKQGDDPTKNDDRFVARISTFGVPEASRRDERHAGSGVSFAFDITEIVDKLKADGAWDPAAVEVWFAPADGSAGAKVKVGRISFYVG